MGCSAGTAGDEGEISFQALTVDSGATYTIVGVASGKCVAIAGASLANSARAILATCASSTSQRFKFPVASGSYYNIVNVASGKCLDVQSKSTANGAAIIQYTCNGGTNQQWSVTTNTNGSVKLTARHSGKVMQPNQGASADGTYMVQSASSSVPYQQFNLAGTGGAAGSGGTGGATAGAGGSTTSSGGTTSSGATSSGGATSTGGTTVTLPAPADLLSAMTKVTAYEIQLGPEDPSWVNKWTEGTFYIGVMAAYLATGDSTYLTDATNWATKNKWTLLGSPTRSADNQCAGQVYEDIYLTNPVAANANMYASTKASIDLVKANPKPGIVMNVDDRWWCDALFMAPGGIARLGQITGDLSYFSFLDGEWAPTQTGLFDTKTGLFWRDSSFVNGTVYWSRGNGWVLAGIVRVLQYLPAADPSYGTYVTLLQTMAAALKPWQQSDGTWHSDLTHPQTYANPEVSGTGLVAYAIAYGISHGLLDRATYLPVVAAAWKGLASCVDAQGRVGYIQATGSKPAAATATETHDYGVGAFLLAASELYTMLR
jgi:rhamnogalacturonyl hydrolase YesR